MRMSTCGSRSRLERSLSRLNKDDEDDDEDDDVEIETVQYI